MSTITIADKFARTDDFASRLDRAFFADEVWAVFAELEQPATAAQIAGRLQESPEDVLNAINLLITHQLVRRQLKSWRDFLAQKGGGATPTDTDASQPPTAPVAEARAAGRPGAALAGWPQPSAPPASPEPEPESALESPAVVAPSFETAGPEVAPAMPTQPEEPPPVLFSDFQLPAKPLHETHRPEAAPEPASSPSPAPAPTAATPEVAPEVPAPSAPTQPAEAPPVLFSDLPLPAPPQPETHRPVSAATAVAVPATPASRPKPAPSSESGTVLPVSFTIANDKARFERKATAAMTISFRIEAARTTAAPTAWKLRPLLQAIEQKGGGGLPGQLLVYRVFIHVPAEMMHAAGIQSISLVDDTVVIRDRAFYDALCQAAHAVASVDLRAIPA